MVKVRKQVKEREVCTAHTDLVASRCDTMDFTEKTMRKTIFKPVKIGLTLW